MHPRKHRKCRRRKRTGAAAVEFAISVLVLFMMIFAFFEYGRALMIEAFVENAAFEAARDVAVLGATIAEGEVVAFEELQILGVQNAEVDVEPLIGGNVQSAISTETEQIRVRVRVPLAQNISFGFFMGSGMMERAAVMETERLK